MRNLHNFLLVFLLSISFKVFSQGSPNYDGGIKVTLNKDGKKYIRIISWAQVQASYADQVADNESNTSFNLRRARILMYAQLNSKFLILTHFGLNSLNSSNMSPIGKGEASQLFFHDVWVQYQIAKNHTVGAGLHYFNGISRLNNQSTLNFLTLDNNRQSWATLGLSDQFVRHIGVFFKGNFEKLQYRLAINDAIVNGLDLRSPTNNGSAVYGGARLLGTKEAGKTFAGYFDYHFLDQESNLLPFKVGSYLGEKRVFNLGFGFFAHPNGAVFADNLGNISGENVSIFAVDTFYDAPLSDKGSSITAYAVYQNNNYGKNYLFNAYGTGSMIYSHLGYTLAGDTSKTRFQPYVSFAKNSYDATKDNRNILGIGANAYFNGHNSKVTLEYQHQKFGVSSLNTLTLQAMIYL
ncbi:hypothetical protein [Polaribacter gangjinensis]|uniref:Porin n=1 Tax=Polaribacter gangjinensis TaxID=574710 RepID=A0A2S7WAQ4_9FLAO|nr:hypothetical protein [Polaribacter gangjinensis]PQJ74710.1 hypothetical protein BTO13_05315 [Polaribacter gangjinensis]